MPGVASFRKIVVYPITVLLGFWSAHADAQVRIDLPAQALSRSLTAVGSLASVNVYYDPPAVHGLQAPALRADLSPAEAISRLITGTHLRLIRVNSNTFRIVDESVTPIGTATHTTVVTGDVYAGEAVRLALADVVEPTADAVTTAMGPSDHSGVNSSGDGKSPLEEVLVTGTNIRGKDDSASPLHTYSRAEIDQSGVGTVQEFLQRLPQNFNGGAAENTAFAGGGGQSNLVSNFANGSAVNLRGLGNTATLVLIDGHRVAAGNSGGEFIDTSMIPLTAVDRIEILTDGASAIYGSDAVGGVVNFIMKRAFQGAETRVRFGEVSSGGTHETQIGQSVGYNWHTGSALLNYEFYDRAPLSAADRSYTDTVAEPFNLLPEQVRSSVFVTANQEMSENLRLYTEASYSHRNSDNFYSFYSTTQHYPSTTSRFGGTAGALVLLPRDLAADISATYGVSDVRAARFLAGKPVPTIDIVSRASVISVDAKLDGTLYEGSQGRVRFAIGGQYRKESFDTVDHAAEASFYPRRNVRAVFAELNVPLVGPVAAGESGDRLALTVAARQEHYSDFGSTANPQIGLVWRPEAQIKLRATYGTSFRAPNLNDLNPVPDSAIPLPEPDPGVGTKSCFPYSASTNCTNVLFVSGGNPSLKAEKATTWTAGADFTAPGVSGLKVGATYYNIRLKGQVNIPQPSPGVFANTFAYASVLGPEILARNPPPSLVQAYASSPHYLNFFGIANDAIGAIYDLRYQNISISNTSGVDIDLHFDRAVGSFNIAESISATRILRFDNRFSPTAPALALLNTPYNPNRLRIRGQSGVTYGPLSVGVYLNYIGPYTSNIVSPAVPVASWTTADLTLSYELPGQGLAGKGRLTFSISNIANRAPPFVLNSQAVYGIPVNYDASNASPLGRFMSLELTKEW